MAGEWLKFDCTLPEKQETLAITAAMGWDDPDTTVGKLMRLFRWFDQQTVDGNAAGVTPALLDRVMGVSGFVSAVASVGWIVATDRGLALANFDRHNGATAKSRVLTAKRVANHKANAQGNAASVSKPLPRVEKSREEIEREEKEKADAKAAAAFAAETFTDFWRQYPKKAGRADALKAWNKLPIDAGLVKEIYSGLCRARTTRQWTDEQGKYIPNAATWLNGKRWEDEGTEAQAQNDPFAGLL